MTWATLSIDRRFCGPPGSGNGGYTAGRLAALIGGPAEITLRRPPPLETEMRVERAGPRLLLMHGEDLIAEAQKTVVELAIPECPSLHEARRASAGYPGLDRHPFPGCFVCGPQRAADGMAVFPGPLTDGRAWAAVWSAAETADAGPTDVLVWAAMDCPGGWSISATDPAATYVLGRMAGQRIRPLDAAPVISLAWLIGRAARKATAGSALFTADGELCAYSKQTWIRLETRRMATPTRRPGAPARGEDMTISRQGDAGTGARFALLSAFYAGVAYLGFLAMFLCAVGFVSGAAVPRTIDSGGPRSNTATAVVIDVLLLALFAIQHTAMARPAFKRRRTRIVPAHVERSTFVLAATAVLALVFWQWRPIPALVWQVDAGPARFVVWAVFAAGWARSQP